MTSLCHDVTALATAGILRSHPEATDDELRYHLAVRRYGEATAAEVYRAPRR